MTAVKPGTVSEKRKREFRLRNSLLSDVVCGRLPEFGSLFGCQPHAVAFLHVPGLYEFRDVRQGGVHAPASQRMNIVVREEDDLLRGDVRGPNVGVGQEEALLGRKAVHFFFVHLFALHGFLHGKES